MGGYFLELVGLSVGTARIVMIIMRTEFDRHFKAISVNWGEETVSG